MTEVEIPVKFTERSAAEIGGKFSVSEARRRFEASTTCVILGSLSIRLLDLVFADAWPPVLLSGHVGCSLEGLM
ncbi:hypothetical protein Bca52824_024752 [Brassica carinata]|uniref:Uncharacterized protein n=1 Tax=Brassica carinata TaxID=52824 RepID=A0A8X8AUZ8_BRACI|nr:hypothetical protein Bca52824_024752 [Brassica carinata]